MYFKAHKDSKFYANIEKVLVRKREIFSEISSYLEGTGCSTKKWKPYSHTFAGIDCPIVFADDEPEISGFKSCGYSIYKEDGVIKGYYTLRPDKRTSLGKYIAEDLDKHISHLSKYEVWEMAGFNCDKFNRFTESIFGWSYSGDYILVDISGFDFELKDVPLDDGLVEITRGEFEKLTALK